MKVRRKVSGFLKLVRGWYMGTRRDGPFFGYLDAARWHSIAVRNQIGHYLHRPPHLEPFEIRLSGFAHSIWLRPQTTDYQVYHQVFVSREYGNFEGITDVGFVLDCGANIGLASVYFLNRFPQARILAVEPDLDNVSLCRRNLQPWGARAMVLQGGLWSDRSRLVVVPSEFGGGNKWGIQVRPYEDGDPEGAAVEGFDIPSLLDYAGADHIDILKVDIERSELPVFASSPDRWLGRVRNIVIELHGDDCSKAFKSALVRYEYRLSHFGDLTYCLGVTAPGGISPSIRS